MTNEVLTLEDLPTLTSHGFEPSWSGASWFGKHRDGRVVQAIIDDDGESLYFVEYESRQRVELNEQDIREGFR